MRDIKAHLQYWDTTPPSRSDILQTLVMALYLLAESLPLALEVIGSKDFATQREFWYSFNKFEEETDLTALHDTSRIASSLCEWADYAHSRIHTPKGEL